MIVLVKLPFYRRLMGQIGLPARYAPLLSVPIQIGIVLLVGALAAPLCVTSILTKYTVADSTSTTENLDFIVYYKSDRAVARLRLDGQRLADVNDVGWKGFREALEDAYPWGRGRRYILPQRSSEILPGMGPQGPESPEIAPFSNMGALEERL